MSDRLDLAARLRAANPLPAPYVQPPAALLDRITGSPRDARRRSLVRRPLLAAVIALLTVAGLALAATFSVRYFDGSGDPLPASVRAGLLHPVAQQGPRKDLAFDQTIPAYTFSSSSVSGRVYVTPYVNGKGFCAALAVRGKPVQASCAGWVVARSSILIGPFPQPWKVTLAPDIHALLGRLVPAAEDETVRLAFEDHSTADLPKQGRWFAYAVAGAHTQVGQRPIELQFLRDGRVLRRVPLNPFSFNTLAEARSLVPQGDGSPAQNAIRAVLLQQLTSPLFDGGQLASHTQLGSTRLLQSIRVGKGLLVRLYGVPISPVMPGPDGRGSLVVALHGSSSMPLFFASGVGSRARRGFESNANGGQLPGHADARFQVITGTVPLGAVTISVRTSGGRELPAAVFDHGRAWAWIARDSVTATRLIARDAAGRVVLSRWA